MRDRLVLGIDTSNYTTSAALCGADGEILLNSRIPLEVREGERGLRQSDAVFLHSKNLPAAAKEVREALLRLPGSKIAAVAVSYAPRDHEGSYMPCFLAGVSAAEMAASALSVPVMYYSHQAGHIMAAAASACSVGGTDVRDFLKNEFMAFHVSGGTTDVLLCRPADSSFRNRMGTRVPFTIEKIGGTFDINCGQAIDRAGVMMGMHFPCGAELDRLACEFTGKISGVKLSVKGIGFNMSGLENKAEDLYSRNGDKAEVSAYVLSWISDTLEKITENAFHIYGRLPIVYSGGVMSSRFIRKRLSGYGAFAAEGLSSDNACGTAQLGAFFGNTI